MKKTLNQEEFQIELEHKETGLNDAQIKQRSEIYGANVLTAKKKKSYLIEFLNEFKDLMVIILIFASIIAFATGESVDGAIILLVIILNAVIGFVQEFKAEKALEALKKMMKPHARVIRNGKQQKILAEHLVPGDVLILDEGDNISADAVIFEENELQTQEAIITGESTPVEKQLNGWIYMGTMVTHGSGRAIVMDTGMKSFMGQIAKLTTETPKDKTPLEKEIDHIGVFVGKVTLVMTIILFVVGFFIQKMGLVPTLIFATSVAVAAVPEGLPTTITIALAIGVQRLAKKNAIVKQLSSVETLGATTVICTDKTGTLTKNEMTVKKMISPHLTVEFSGIGYSPEGKFTLKHHEKSSTKTEEHLNLLAECATLCNNATLIKSHNSWKILGDPTEGALVTMSEKLGKNQEQLNKEYTKIHEYPFDSNQKRMSVVMHHKDSDEYLLFTKGAPGSLEHISNISREMIEESETMANNALRCLAFGYRKLTPHEIEHLKKRQKVPREKIEQNLEFLGITGMIDPPREEVKHAVEMAKLAGIKVYIITGDHGLTARAIAKEIGLFHEKNHHRIIEGDELDNIADKELYQLLKDKELEIIFARVNPEHKLRIVSALKHLKEVVAVTGDGVNDAPALKRADIGVAMGITGTDVSKEASNMILNDDSFSTIVVAIQEGRTIYENLKKFIFFIFSSNIGEVFMIFMAIMLNLPMPLTAILILVINLATDILPAIALGIEPTEKDVMKQKPRHTTDKILNKHFIQRFLFIGASIGTIVTLFYLWVLASNPGIPVPFNEESIEATHIITMNFVLLTMIQMANAINARSDHRSIFKTKFFSNPKLIIAIISSILLTIAIVYVPFFQKYLHTAPLSFQDWAVITLASLSIIALEECRKLLLRLKLRQKVASTK